MHLLSVNFEYFKFVGEKFLRGYFHAAPISIADASRVLNCTRVTNSQMPNLLKQQQHIFSFGAHVSLILKMRKLCRTRRFSLPLLPRPFICWIVEKITHSLQCSAPLLKTRVPFSLSLVCCYLQSTHACSLSHQFLLIQTYA